MGAGDPTVVCQKEILGGIDGDNPARAVIEAQDREIAERSGQLMPEIKLVKRSA